MTQRRGWRLPAEWEPQDGVLLAWPHEGTDWAPNLEAAEHVVAMKREINRLADSAALHEARRLVAEEPNRLPAYTVEMDILENLKRIFYFCKRIARGVVTSEGAGNPAGASAPPAS